MPARMSRSTETACGTSACMTSAFTGARHNQPWQIVLSKDGMEGGYDSVR